MINVWSARALEPCQTETGVSVAAVDEDGRFSMISLEDLYRPDADKAAKAVLLPLVSDHVWPLPNEIDLHKAPREKNLPDVLARIVRLMKRYVWIDDDRVYEEIAVWIIASYFRKNFRFIPLLIIDGVTQAGKSTLLKLIGMLEYRGFVTSGCSYASIVRLTEQQHVSVCIDEGLDNLDNEVRGNDLVNMLKAAVDPDGIHTRADAKTQKVHIYHPYTSAAVTTKGESLPLDLVNRGVRVQMVASPDTADLMELSWAEQDLAGSDLSPSGIRTDLYALRLLCMTNRTGDIPDWKLLIGKANQHLTEKIGDEWMYAYVLDIPGGPRIRNRLRDIASTLYPVAMATDSDRDVMELLIEGRKNVSETAETTMESQTFRAFVDVIREKMSEEGLLAQSVPLTHDRWAAIVSHISTKMIADRYNQTQHDNGDCQRFEDTETWRITYTIKSLGLSICSKRGIGGGQSAMDPRAAGFDRLFLQHIKTYDPDNYNLFKGVVEK